MSPVEIRRPNGNIDRIVVDSEIVVDGKNYIPLAEAERITHIDRFYLMGWHVNRQQPRFYFHKPTGEFYVPTEVVQCIEDGTIGFVVRKST